MSAGTDMSAKDADTTLDNAAHGGCPATTCCASSDGPKKFSPEWKAKIAEGMRRAHAEKRAGGFVPENRAWEKITPAGRRKTVAAAVAKTTGAGGFGKMKVGREDHQFAATWIIEDPDGEEIEVNNLREWCRANAHRFEPDPGCKMPIWERAAAGMRAAAPGNKYGRTHWKGWRVIQILHNESTLPTEGAAKNL